MNLTINNSPQVFSEKLAGGLRIRESETKEAEVLGLAPGIATVAPIVANISDIGKFASEFLRRCRASSTGDEEAACLLTESVVNAASEISSRLGQEKAAEFLNKIMDYTERGMNENRLAGAVSDFFEQFRKEAVTDKALTTELLEITRFFNRGLDILIDKDNMLPERLAKGERPGLAFAMNNFFATDFTVSEEGGRVTAKGFDFYFDRNKLVDRIELTYTKEPEWLEDGPAGPGYYAFVGTGKNVTASELIGSETDDTLLKVADYLRTEIGNEKAAAWLETLTADSKVMEAIDSTIAIVAMENGFDKAIEYVRHLNGNMKNAINSVTPEGLTFGGWTIHSPLKTSKHPNSGLTLHGGLDDIFGKGHLALDCSWQNSNGVGVTTSPKNLNELYSRLR